MFEGLLSDYNREMNEECISEVDDDKYLIIKEKRIGKTYKVISNNEGYKVEQRNVKCLGRMGVKYGNYVELLFDYSDDYCIDENGENGFDMFNFFIGKIEVMISKPTLLFDIVCEDINSDKYYCWDDQWTISLKGINNNNYHKYLEEALFIIRYFSSASSYYWEPKCLEYYGYYDALMLPDNDAVELVEEHRVKYPKYNGTNFEEMNYYEPVAFFNEGKRLGTSEMSFQYYYKVLEFFFYICIKDEFVCSINEYNATQNIDKYINDIHKKCFKKEEEQLIVLLHSIEEAIEGYIKAACKKGIINDEKVETFAKKMYLHRNSIVHGKSEKKFELNLPLIVKSDKELFWNTTIAGIAEILIRKYCL